MDVRDGVQLIGKTGPKSFLCWEREPGQTTILGNAENVSSLPLIIAKGEVYYIQQRPRWGLTMARNELRLMKEEVGKKTLAKCKPPKVKYR